MNNLQKIGGVAALIEAFAYITGFVLYFGVLDASGYTGPYKDVAFLVDHQGILAFGNIVIFVVFSIFLVVLALALHDRLKAGSAVIMQIATSFALIWAGLVVASGMILNIGMETVIGLYATEPAQASTIWKAVSAVQEGLGGGVEVVGGLWVLLVSWVALRAGGLPKALNALGLAIGIAGMVTVVPALGELGAAVFGLGQIVWFVWLGVVLMSGAKSDG